MTDADIIYRHADRLMQKYGTNDPSVLARDMGIMVRKVPDLTDMLGMYVYRWKHRIIFINPNKNAFLYRMVMAHEIGHDQLHRDYAGNGDFKEFEIFNIVDSTEYEANAFAAHILIDSEEMLEMARGGYDVTQIASALKVNVNLVLIKEKELRRMGMDLRLPYEPDARFSAIHDIKESLIKSRLTAWRTICLHIFRHLAQFLLAIHTVSRRRH